MVDVSRDPAWWAPLRPPREPVAVTRLISDGTLDAELAALVWLLVEGHVPLVVAAGPRRAGKTTLLTALLDFLPSDAATRVLAGALEDFSWLPQAPELGWHRATPTGPGRAPDPARTWLLVPELSPHLPHYTWGSAARVAIRALQLGYALAGTIHADSLAELLATLTAPPVGLSEDEVRRLGVVLVLRAAPGPPMRRRVVAAHYLRPLERDGHGHLQRRPPGVLAARDEASDALEHFAWGITSELAVRIGRRPEDLERALAERAAFLAGLVSAGVSKRSAVQRALAEYRAATGAGGTLAGPRH